MQLFNKARLAPVSFYLRAGGKPSKNYRIRMLSPLAFHTPCTAASHIAQSRQTDASPHGKIVST